MTNSLLYITIAGLGWVYDVPKKGSGYTIRKMKKKKISAAAIYALKEALTHVFWYVSDLRSFLTQIISESAILARLNWGDYKRNIVGTLVDYLAKNEEQYQGLLLQLMTDVCQMSDFSHLLHLDKGKEKEQRARQAVSALREQMKGYLKLQEEKVDAEKRREESHKKMIHSQGVRDKLTSMSKEYFSLLSDPDFQGRGFKLEKLLRNLFELFDLDPKASFKIVGEQIDGAFTFGGTDYLLEARWRDRPTIAEDLDSLHGKLTRKLDNTLGLYLSINGYSEDAVKTFSSGRRLVILMDGSDLMAVLEGRIDLVKLLLRKRREAATTGNIYLKIHEIMKG